MGVSQDIIQSCCSIYSELDRQKFQESEETMLLANPKNQLHYSNWVKREKKDEMLRRLSCQSSYLMVTEKNSAPLLEIIGECLRTTYGNPGCCVVLY
jgi:hypothetical protein